LNPPKYGYLSASTADLDFPEEIGKLRQRDPDMQLRIYKPGFPLSQNVEHIWLNTSSTAPSSRQRVYPDAAMALVIHLEKPTMSFWVDNERRSTQVPLLAGPWTRPFEFDPSESTAVMAVQFRPGAARMLFPVAAHELHNVDLALRELCPKDADRLINDACSAIGERARFRVVEQYLKEKLKNAVPPHAAVAYAVGQLSHGGGVSSIRRIQQNTGLSHTRFIQLFREHVGVTPKLFYRVRRFHALLSRIEKGLHVRWADLAADCGYFDQAHLVRDFRAFAGITPGAYSQSVNEDERILLAADVMTG
jgi:AraC-like DNA-binding protein